MLRVILDTALLMDLLALATGDIRVVDVATGREGRGIWALSLSPRETASQSWAEDITISSLTSAKESAQF